MAKERFQDFRQNDSFLEAYKYRAMREGREREEAEYLGRGRKRLNEKELIIETIRDLGWAEEFKKRL